MSTSVVGLRSSEKELALEQALSVVRKPDGVGRPKILFGTDHSGDAAVHIVYPASTKIKLTRSRTKVLLNFYEAIQSRIRELPLDVIAYVRFTEANR